jgi:hypothetical protein
MSLDPHCAGDVLVWDNAEAKCWLHNEAGLQKTDEVCFGADMDKHRDAFRL